MTVNPNIFKTYDLRGVYPTELNEELTITIAAAFYAVFNPGELIIGYDARNGSRELASVFSEEICKYGTNVTNIGLVSTPRLYYATHKLNAAFGIIVTASHAPIDQTGLKFIINHNTPTVEHIVSLRQKIEDLNQNLQKLPDPTTTPGQIRTVSIDQSYIEELRHFKPYKFKPFRVVFDCGNSVNGPIARKVFEDLGLGENTYLFEDIDPNFPHHELNPKFAKNREQLVQKVIETKADLGIIWDGDGDRAYFVDHDGEVISPHFVSALIGEYLIKDDKRKKMTIEVRTSQVVPDIIDKIGGTVEVIKAWHTEIKYAMQKDPEIIFGSETSGHYVFRDFYMIDDGLLATLTFLAAISEKPEPVAKIIDAMQANYFIKEEINFDIPKDLDSFLTKMAANYSDAEKTIWIDGLTIIYPKWRFNLRASLSEPFIRLNISATSEQTLNEEYQKIEHFMIDNGCPLAES